MEWMVVVGAVFASKAHHLDVYPQKDLKRNVDTQKDIKRNVDTQKR